MMRILKRWGVAALGSEREVRVVSALCFGLYVAATLGADVAQAATPPLLPPLPTYAALDDPAVSAKIAQETAPLPSGGLGQAANPFGDVSTPKAAQDPDTVEPAPRAATAPDASPDDAANGPILPPSPKLPTAPARDDGAGTPSLEGPPVPLPPRPRLADASAGADSGLPAGNKPISLNFQHAQLGAVLKAFAEFTGLNIVASDKVRGAVSIRLDQVPWRTAFDTPLDVNNLAMERHGNVIWVAPAAELAARERQRFEAHARAADLEPLASRTFELHYAHAEDVRRLLTGSGTQRVLSKRGAVTADPRTNLLFVTDLAGRLEQIAALIASVDRPTRQVLIEAQIVEGEQGFSRNLGVRLSLAGTSADGTSRGLTGGTDGTVYDLSARPISGFDAATAGLTLFAAHATRLLNIELSALESEGHGKIVSSPRVVTADRMKAIVEQGTELPYQAKVGQGVSGVQFRRATLKLEVEPQIMPDGRVVLDLDVAKDSVGEQTDAGPAINTKHVQTRVEVEDGGTVSIGGIYETDDRDDVERVPILGKIPVLGGLFRHRTHRDTRSELAVFITPRVVREN
ncbi:type IV pilus assembly protein PilQ [Paraburkholderia atlantica]|uniref:type IV pilus secretin PilQ n=1 Tax=Paraburkholderia atlantica TaxID=2654982 RepID=UPI003D24CE06